MKKILTTLVILVVIILSGCTKVTGDYKEGVYFAYDKDTKYSVVVYVDNTGQIKNVFFDAIYLMDCKVRNDISTCQDVTTKQALGDNYDMKKVSSINQEWYEQVNNFSDKVVKEQGLDWLELKYKDAEGHITTTQPTNQEAKDKVYTDSVAGVTIVVDNLARLVNDALKQAGK
ncbi:MAG: hypothetical protein ACOXZW_03415 [Bacilli bacterium]|jgi:hypothetical protein